LGKRICHLWPLEVCRAESPYNGDYLTAAFASGSSNGSATATAASFGVFGMGEETISSGRSPASNNGLVAYTPSRGLISIRGNWPLFPTCDTVVPHTRTMSDMFSLLDVIVAKDEKKECDFWREQPFVALPDVNNIRPKSYHALSDATALAGKRIRVPKMYIGGHDPEAIPVHTRKSVIGLWKNAKAVLESLGATVEEVDFPVVTNFEKVNDVPDSSGSTALVHRNDIDMCKLMAYGWDDFLTNNDDTSCATTLATVDSATIFPRPAGSLPARYDATDPLVRHKDVVAHVKGGRVPAFKIPGLGHALQTLEDRRKSDFEDWLVEKALDVIVWPCNGDVGHADADINEASAQDAWRNGVLHSNGNCSIRQLGIPTVSVPMGVMDDTKMPVNPIFASKAYDDNNIFRYAFAFEFASKLRQRPGHTPSLDTVIISLENTNRTVGSSPPELSAEVRSVKSKDGRMLQMSGSYGTDNGSGVQSPRVYVDGEEVRQLQVKDGKWESESKVFHLWKGRPEEKGVLNPELAMVVIVASGKNGRSTGKLLFV
jgi:amidase